MNFVTSLSETWPMYVFHILEGMSDAGVKVGFSQDMASAFAAQALIESSRIIQATQEHPARLKDLGVMVEIAS